MGVDVRTARFLASEARRGVDFTRTLTLGRQSLCMNHAQYREVFPGGEPAQPVPAGGFADEFLSALGARNIDAIDVSDYEGANIIHDLNTPLEVDASGRWTCVFDGGALEHIFHFPSAIRSCMEATAVGGHFISACPWTGLAGHGFYQFSPELLYRVLSPENGFRVERMLFPHRNRWRSIADPQSTGRRFQFQSKGPVLLFVSARRTHEAEIFKTPPQQSDYVAMWASTPSGAPSAVPGFARRAVETLLPGLAAKVRAWREERRLLAQGTDAAEL